MECAYAGCETIWIVADPDITPVFKRVIGDFVYDPVNYVSDTMIQIKEQKNNDSDLLYNSGCEKQRQERQLWMEYH